MTPPIGDDQDHIRGDELPQERGLDPQVREGDSRERPHHENIRCEEILVKRAYENRGGDEEALRALEG